MGGRKRKGVRKREGKGGKERGRERKERYLIFGVKNSHRVRLVILEKEERRKKERERKKEGEVSFVKHK